MYNKKDSYLYQIQENGLLAIQGLGIIQGKPFQKIKLQNQKFKDPQVLNRCLAKSKNLTPQQLNVVLNIIKQNINKSLSQFNQKLKYFSNKLTNVNLLIGATGSGKSTLYNYLKGQVLNVLNYKGRIALDVDAQKYNQQSFAFISHNFTSATTTPNLWYDSVNSITHIDCPGQQENRGLVQTLINNKLKEVITNHCQKIKLTFVVNYHSLESNRSTGFSQLLKNVANSLKNKEQFLNTQCFSMVITHVNESKKNTASTIISMLQQIVKGQSSEFNNFFLSSIIRRNAIILFVTPKKKIITDKQGDEIQVIQQGRYIVNSPDYSHQNIKHQLSKVKYLAKSRNLFQIIPCNNYENAINHILDSYAIQFKIKMHKSLKQYFDYKFYVTDIEDLKYIQQKNNQIQQLRIFMYCKDFSKIVKKIFPDQLSIIYKIQMQNMENLTRLFLSQKIHKYEQIFKQIILNILADKLDDILEKQKDLKICQTQKLQQAKKHKQKQLKKQNQYLKFLKQRQQKVKKLLYKKMELQKKIFKAQQNRMQAKIFRHQQQYKNQVLQYGHQWSNLLKQLNELGHNDETYESKMGYSPINLLIKKCQHLQLTQQQEQDQQYYEDEENQYHEEYIYNQSDNNQDDQNEYSNRYDNQEYTYNEQYGYNSNDNYEQQYNYNNKQSWLQPQYELQVQDQEQQQNNIQIYGKQAAQLISNFYKFFK